MDLQQTALLSLFLYFFIIIVYYFTVYLEPNIGHTAKVKIPEIEISQGKLRGTILYSRGNKVIYSFLGIPYARPPVGPLRFQSPQPPLPWTGVKSAIKDGIKCPQMDYEGNRYMGSEDCLYLNVYTDTLPNVTSARTKRKDVVVVFHGGGFTYGSGELNMYGPEYLLDRHVVMVTCNYRLGALGFLATGDESSPGNYGLKDQVAVLQWVQENIQKFSGNPDKVTLLGVHAGGASVHYHLLSRESHGLFLRAISHSGTALTPWAHVTNTTAWQRAVTLGELVECNMADLKNRSELVNCLRNKSAYELVKMSSKVLNNLTLYAYPFVPVNEEGTLYQVENVRLSSAQEESLGRLSNVQWLVGIPSYQGLPSLISEFVLPHVTENEQILQILGLEVNSQEKAEQLIKLISNFYLTGDIIAHELAEMVHDFTSYYGLVKSVRTHVRDSSMRTYVYHFSYHWQDIKVGLKNLHGFDTSYLFPTFVGDDHLIFAEEFHVADLFLHFVTNFIHKGHPTPTTVHSTINNIIWPVVTADSFQYVDIGNTVAVKKNFFYRNIVALWSKMYRFLSGNYDTYA